MILEFLELFRGNPATVGLDNAVYGHRPGPYHIGPRTNWSRLIREHLKGKRSIGVYPYCHVYDGVCWGCVDLDEGEEASWAHALNLREVLFAVGIEAWIERSRSKGYHVWVFASSWTPATVMRRLLIGACQVVGVPHREVNPKSEHLEADQLGNFVRLPMFGALKGPIERQVVVDLLGVPFPLELFVVEALERRVEPLTLEMVANTLYVPPEPPRVVLLPADGPWMERLNTLARIQLEEGPRAGSDRSSYLMAFAHACAESGLDEDEVRAAVQLADEMHTHKYEFRRDADRRYADIAARGMVPTPYDEQGEYDD